jgi:Uma2 family endonuclease
MTASHQERWSEDDYLALERQAIERHEYLHGVVVGMAGGSLRHNLICSNVSRALGSALRGRCFVLSSDQRVHVPATGLYTYPDVTVVCGDIVSHPKDADTVINPSLLVEVLSPNTEAHDRGAKAAHYRGIPCLKAYLLIAQAERRVEHYARMDTGQWLLTEYVTEAEVQLPPWACAISMADIYDQVDRLPTGR